MTVYRQSRPLSIGAQCMTVNPCLLPGTQRASRRTGVTDNQWQRGFLQKRRAGILPLRLLRLPFFLVPCSFCPSEIILFEITSSENRKGLLRERQRGCERCAWLDRMYSFMYVPRLTHYCTNDGKQVNLLMCSSTLMRFWTSICLLFHS